MGEKDFENLVNICKMVSGVLGIDSAVVIKKDLMRA